MNKYIKLSALLLMMVLSSCSEDEEDSVNNFSQNQTSLKSLTTNHEKNSGSQRGSSISGASVNGVSFSNISTPKGRAVRDILFLEELDSQGNSSRTKKQSTGEESGRLIWFVDQINGEDVSDDYSNSLAYWFYDNGTYDVYDWETEDFSWGYWYVSESGDQIAFDIDSDFEEVYNIEQYSNFDMTLVSKDNDSFLIRGYDVESDEVETSFTKDQIMDILNDKFWGYYSVDSYDENGEFLQGLSEAPEYGIDQTIEYFHPDGGVHVFAYDTIYNELGEPEVVGDWVSDAYEWDYDETSHAILYGEELWYISWIDENDFEVYTSDEMGGIVSYWQENVEYWHEKELEVGADLPQN